MRKLVIAVAIVACALLVWLALRHESESSAAREPARSDRATKTSKTAVAPLTVDHSDAAQPDLANAREEVAISAAATAPQPVVRLLDERTGEPVPFFALEVEPTGRERIAMSTDIEGRLALPTALDTTLHLAENLRVTDRIQTRRDCATAIAKSVDLRANELGDAVLDVRAPIGPTYRLRIAPPSGHTLGDLSATLRAADPRQAFDSAFADLREDATPWVRFQATALCLIGGPPWKLELTARDGLWFGAAEVATNEGVQREVVAIEFVRRARLFGTVRDDNGDVQPGFVRIERSGASFASAENRPLFGLTAADASYAIRCVPAGNYTVRFHAENHRDFEAQVELVEGEARELAIVVERIPPDALATIAGRVDTASGNAHESLVAYAIPDDEGLSPRRVAIAWKEINGRMIGSFSIEVPPSGYRVCINGGGLLDVEPREQHWQPETGALTFLVRDSNATARIEFRAVDPHDGSALSSFHVQLRAMSGRDSAFLDVAARDGVALFDSVPLARTCEYRALADGRQSVWGEFTTTEESLRAIVVNLAHGWSTEVSVTDDTGAALAAVRVLFDDELAGTTGERGTFRVSLEQSPTSVRFERDGWRAIDTGDYSSSTGRFRSWLPWLTMSMQRVE